MPTEIYVALISGIAIICAAVLPAILIERARKENADDTAVYRMVYYTSFFDFREPTLEKILKKSKMK